MAAPRLRHFHPRPHACMQHPHVSTMSSTRSHTFRVLFVTLVLAFLAGAHAMTDMDTHEEESTWACTATCGESAAYSATVRTNPDAFPQFPRHAWPAKSAFLVLSSSAREKRGGRGGHADRHLIPGPHQSSAPTADLLFRTRIVHPFANPVNPKPQTLQHPCGADEYVTMEENAGADYSTCALTWARPSSQAAPRRTRSRAGGRRASDGATPRARRPGSSATTPRSRWTRRKTPRTTEASLWDAPGATA